MSYPEPQHDTSVRSTASSKAEGRMKESVSGMRKKKRKILRNIIKKIDKK